MNVRTVHKISLIQKNHKVSKKLVTNHLKIMPQDKLKGSLPKILYALVRIPFHAQKIQLLLQQMKPLISIKIDLVDSLDFHHLRLKNQMFHHLLHKERAYLAFIYQKIKKNKANLQQAVGIWINSLKMELQTMIFLGSILLMKALGQYRLII